MGAFEFLCNYFPGALAQIMVRHEGGIDTGDGEVGLCHRELNVADQIVEQWKIREHVAQQPLRFLSLGSKTFQRISNSEPCRKCVTALHPPEHPGNGAQIFQSPPMRAARWPGPDLRVLQFVDRGGLLEISEYVQVLCNVTPVESEGILRHL